MNIKGIEETKNAINEIGYILEVAAHMKCDTIEYTVPDSITGTSIGVGLEFTNNFAKVVITRTLVHDTEMIKIEAIFVKEKFRDRTIGTKLLNTITRICTKNKCKVGLWVDVNDLKLIKWYNDRGFELIETVDDHWLEYNL